MDEDELKAECLEWFDNAQQIGYLAGIPEDQASRDALAATAAGWIKSIVEECGGVLKP